MIESISYKSEYIIFWMKQIHIRILDENGWKLHVVTISEVQ